MGFGIGSKGHGEVVNGSKGMFELNGSKEIESRVPKSPSLLEDFRFGL